MQKARWWALCSPLINLCESDSFEAERALFFSKGVFQGAVYFRIQEKMSIVNLVNFIGSIIGDFISTVAESNRNH